MNSLSENIMLNMCSRSDEVTKFSTLSSPSHCIRYQNTHNVSVHLGVDFHRELFWGGACNCFSQAVHRTKLKANSAEQRLDLKKKKSSLYFCVIWN